MLFNKDLHTIQELESELSDMEDSFEMMNEELTRLSNARNKFEKLNKQGLSKAKIDEVERKINKAIIFFQKKGKSCTPDEFEKFSGMVGELHSLINSLSKPSNLNKLNTVDQEIQQMTNELDSLAAVCNEEVRGMLITYKDFSEKSMDSTAFNGFIETAPEKDTVQALNYKKKYGDEFKNFRKFYVSSNLFMIEKIKLIKEKFQNDSVDLSDIEGREGSKSINEINKQLSKIRNEIEKLKTIKEKIEQSSQNYQSEQEGKLEKINERLLQLKNLEGQDESKTRNEIEKLKTIKEKIEQSSQNYESEQVEKLEKINERLLQLENLEGLEEIREQMYQLRKLEEHHKVRNLFNLAMIEVTRLENLTVTDPESVNGIKSELKSLTDDFIREGYANESTDLKKYEERIQSILGKIRLQEPLGTVYKDLKSFNTSYRKLLDLSYAGYIGVGKRVLSFQPVETSLTSMSNSNIRKKQKINKLILKAKSEADFNAIHALVKSLEKDIDTAKGCVEVVLAHQDSWQIYIDRTTRFIPQTLRHEESESEHERSAVIHLNRIVRGRVETAAKEAKGKMELYTQGLKPASDELAALVKVRDDKTTLLDDWLIAERDYNKKLSQLTGKDSEGLVNKIKADKAALDKSLEKQCTIEDWHKYIAEVKGLIT